MEIIWKYGRSHRNISFDSCTLFYLVKRSCKHVRCSICSLQDNYQYNWIKMSVKSVVWKLNHAGWNAKWGRSSEHSDIAYMNILKYALPLWCWSDSRWRNQQSDLFVSFSEPEEGSRNWKFKCWLIFRPPARHLCKDNRKYFLRVDWPHFKSNDIRGAICHSAIAWWWWC